MIALGGGLGEPVVGLPLVVFFQIQLAERILCVLVPGFSALGEVSYRFSGVLRYDFTFKILLAQPIGGVAIFILCGVLQPLDSQTWIVDFRILGEQ